MSNGCKPRIVSCNRIDIIFCPLQGKLGEAAGYIRTTSRK